MKSKNIILETTFKHLLLSLAIFITILLAILSALLPPYYLAKIIDSLNDQTYQIKAIVIIYFLTLILSNLFISLRDGLLVVYGQKITKALRNTLMQKYYRLDCQTMAKYEPGNIVSSFINDVDSVETLFTSGIISLVADLISLISILIIIFNKAKGLFVMLLIIIPLIYLFTRYIQKNTLKSEIENKVAVSKANAFIPESIHNIFTIHNLNKEKHIEQKYGEYITKGYNALNKTNFYDAIYSPIIKVVYSLIISIVILLASGSNQTLLTLFALSAGDTIMIINYISQIFGPIESIGMEITTIQSAMSGIKRIDEFLSLKEKEISRNEAICNTKQNIVINIENIDFSYTDKKIFDKYSLQISNGQKVTFVGRTGCGKSTLFKLILGLYKPTKGKITIFGVEPYHLDNKQRRKIFGYVEQSFKPIIGSIKDNITLYDETISDDEVIEALKKCNLYNTVNNFEKGIYTDCKEELFSKGQWQLLSIARAIVCDPFILMLDEISANLDSETEKEIFDTFNNIAKNKTVISISHRANANIGTCIKIN